MALHFNLNGKSVCLSPEAEARAEALSREAEIARERDEEAAWDARYEEPQMQLFRFTLYDVERIDGSDEVTGKHVFADFELPDVDDDEMTAYIAPFMGSDVKAYVFRYREGRKAGQSFVYLSRFYRMKCDDEVLEHPFGCFEEVTK